MKLKWADIKPIFISLNEDSKGDLKLFLKNHPQCKIVDHLKVQLEELFEIQHPTLIGKPNYELERSKFIDEITQGTINSAEKWAYFPWSDTLVHVLNEQDYYRVRTNRNQLLINSKEQQLLRNFSVGIVGLSIGGVMAQTLVRMGISNKMKLIDFDTISLSNLNRLPHGILSLGKSKAIEEAMSLYEIDPYARLQVASARLTLPMLEDFISDMFIPNLLVDAIDDFQMKVKLRIEARKRGIPVVMLTSLGDRLLVDVERYDLDQQYPLFHGLVDEVVDDILESKEVTLEVMKKFAVQLVGKQNVPRRAIASLSQLNKTLVGRPQLYSTVQYGAATLSKVVRKIALKQSCKSGRYIRKIV